MADGVAGERVAPRARLVPGQNPGLDRIVVEGGSADGWSRYEAARVVAKVLTLVIGTDDGPGREICQAIGEQVEKAQQLGRFGPDVS